MKVSTLGFMLLVFIASSCHSYKRQITKDYYKHARSHRLIAVVPFDITVKGKTTRELTPDEINTLILEESELYQQSLYSELLRRSGNNDKDIQVSIQDTRSTNRLLSEAGIDGLSISDYTARQLGEVLGVDAIVSVQLIKEKFLNREMAMAAEILRETARNSPISIPTTVAVNSSKLTRSSKVDMYSYVLDVDTETALWQYNFEYDLSWDVDPDDAIEKINARIARRFPYRNQD